MLRRLVRGIVFSGSRKSQNNNKDGPLKYFVLDFTEIIQNTMAHY